MRKTVELSKIAETGCLFPWNTVENSPGSGAIALDYDNDVGGLGS